MHKNVIIVAKLVGAAWLIYATFVAAVLAAISIPHGPYVPMIVLGITAFLCLGATAMLWRNRSLHWLTIVAFVLSIGLAVYGQLFQ